MIRLLRVFSFVLMVCGVLVILTWLVKPLREAWPLLIQWYQSLPVAIQAGLAIAAIGFLLLLSSIIWERLEDRKSEGNLLDDE